MTITLPETDQKRRTGVLLAAFSAGLFSLKGVVIKLALAEGMSVGQILTWRMAFALPVYLIVGAYALARLRRKLHRRPTRSRPGSGSSAISFRPISISRG
jgi:hypothetical protein